MELKDAIYSRHSVRNFTPEMVDKQMIDELLNAAVQAPSAMNVQPWAFSVIQDNDLLKDLSTRAKTYLLNRLDETPLMEKYRGALSNPNFNIFYNASTLLTIYAKPDGLRPVDDCSLAAQNIMLMARSLGLGTCWIGFAQTFLDVPEMKAELNVPSEYSIVAPLVIGHPSGDSKAIQKQKPEILFWK